MYLILTLITIVAGLAMVITRRADMNVARRPLRSEWKTISGEPAIAFGLMYLVLGSIFLIDAILALETGESKLSWIFCGSWILIGIVFNLYVNEHGKSRK